MTLISRLESATEGSPQLDVAIAKALGWTQVWHGEGLPPRAEFLEPIPAYTSRPHDLTAALSAMPEGLTVRRLSQGRRGWTAAVGKFPVGKSRLAVWTHEAATPALALMAAILRAREIGEK